MAIHKTASPGEIYCRVRHLIQRVREAAPRYANGDHLLGSMFYLDPVNNYGIEKKKEVQSELAELCATWPRIVLFAQANHIALAEIKRMVGDYRYADASMSVVEDEAA